jgi:hypothetical protein
LEYYRNGKIKDFIHPTIHPSILMDFIVPQISDSVNLFFIQLIFGVRQSLLSLRRITHVQKQRLLAVYEVTTPLPPFDKGDC